MELNLSTAEFLLPGMPIQELLDFIKKSKEAGQGDEEIKSALKNAGWQGEDVEKGFRSQSLDAQPVPSAPPIRPAQPAKPTQNYSDILYGAGKKEPAFITPEGKSSKKLIVAIVIIFILLAGAASAYYFRDDLAGLPVIKNLVKKDESVVVSDTSQQQEQQQVAPLPNTGEDKINNKEIGDEQKGKTVILQDFEITISPVDYSKNQNNEWRVNGRIMTQDAQSQEVVNNLSQEILDNQPLLKYFSVGKLFTIYFTDETKISGTQLIEGRNEKTARIKGFYDTVKMRFIANEISVY